MNSALQFPNARLLIHNLLADEHLTGAEAIARGAREYGVLSKEDSDSPDDADLKKAIESCDCCEAAHCVLRQYFKLKVEEAPDAIDGAWKSLITRLYKYRVKLAKEMIIEPKDPNCYNTCAGLAPIIFDLMLQEVRRYS